ncbi:MAG TPA: hypothetical protein DEP84_34085 [Chloroflexi bacterium]|nr:hypothetical protein [Chloroflexota bacterium]
MLSLRLTAPRGICCRTPLQLLGERLALPPLLGGALILSGVFALWFADQVEARTGGGCGGRPLDHERRESTRKARK